MPAAKSAASEPAAEQGAAQALAGGGNAIDAVIGGFLASAATGPGTLLGPLVALVGGLGGASRCIDGRSAQPGRGLARPRGLRSHDAVPAAARAAAPRSLAALGLLAAYGATMPLSTHARRAAALARKGGAPRRARVLAALAEQGAAALTRSSELARALLAAAGPAEGGLLSADDLGENLPGDHRLAPREHDGLAVAVAPFADVGTRAAHVVVAADPHGLVAALAYSPDPDGVAVPDLELQLPGDADPVRRGVPRVKPGTPRPTATPIALLARAGEGWYAALGAWASHSLEDARIDGGELAARGLGPLLSSVRQALDARSVLAASVVRRRTQLTRA